MLRTCAGWHQSQACGRSAEGLRRPETRHWLPAAYKTQHLQEPRAHVSWVRWSLGVSREWRVLFTRLVLI